MEVPGGGVIISDEEAEGDSAPMVLVKYWLWAIAVYLLAASIAIVWGARLTGVSNFVPSLPRFTRASGRPHGLSESDPWSLHGSLLRRPRSSTFFEADSFEDPLMEKQWREISYEKLLKNGSMLLHLWVWLLMIYRNVRNLRADPCLEGRYVAHSFEFAGQISLLCSTFFCWQKPRGYLYWSQMLVLCGYCMASMLPPFQWGCSELSGQCKDATTSYIQQAVRNHDCSLTGITATLMCMTWILLLPWLVYTKKMIHLTWLWVLVYLLWSILYMYIKETWIFTKEDVIGRLFVIATTVVIATVKKTFLESSSIKKFHADVEMQKASQRIFRVFQYMVPTHVVVPMLKNPGGIIAEPVDKVTIMFILIVDFDAYAHSSTPEQLLRFLNEQFSGMDRICMQNEVTKIETVGEEYVACVGVVPSDIEEAARNGHSSMLKRMFRAGDEILQLQTDQLQFKIGLHTGPIVAGVIGNKLPRYRLFGDTINTAARMMQKGVAGRLQFGEATHNDLPDTVETSYRGEVEMKGKGMVKAWLFERLKPRSEHGRPSVFLQPDELSGALFKDDDALFEAVIEGLKVDPPQARFSAFSLLPIFTQEMEEEWFQEFHKQTFMKKFVQRMTRQIFLLLGVGMFELIFLAGTIIHYGRDYSLYVMPLLKFVSCQLVSLAMLAFWRFAYARWPNWMMESAADVQRGIGLTTGCLLVLAYIGHDVLTSELPNEGSERSVHGWKVMGPPHDQLFLPIFVLIFYMFSTMHSFRSGPTLFIIPLGVGLMCVSHEKGVGTLYFSTSGKVLFVINCAMIVIAALHEEQGSRLRFRARAVVDETRERTETILRTLMPPMVVDKLRDFPGQAPSHHYKSVTVQQSDLCGFTKLAATRTPREVVDFISELFGMFDELTDKFGVYKVETIGDAYIAGQGDQPLTYEHNPVNVIRFGLASVEAVNKWSARLGGDPVGCRVGIHHGECIGGVVGTDMQRYHLFGGLMTVLEVLESCGKEGMVHVSTAAWEAVKSDYEDKLFTDLKFEKRTDPDLRTSKGEVHTYEEAEGPTYFVSMDRLI